MSRFGFGFGVNKHRGGVGASAFTPALWAASPDYVKAATYTLSSANAIAEMTSSIGQWRSTGADTGFDSATATLKRQVTFKVLAQDPSDGVYVGLGIFNGITFNASAAYGPEILLGYSAFSTLGWRPLDGSVFLDGANQGFIGPTAAVGAALSLMWDPAAGTVKAKVGNGSPVLIATSNYFKAVNLVGAMLPGMSAYDNGGKVQIYGDGSSLGVALESGYSWWGTP